MSRTIALLAASMAMSACLLAPDPEDGDSASLVDLAAEPGRTADRDSLCGAPGTMSIPIAAIPGSQGRLCDRFPSGKRRCLSTDRQDAIARDDTVACGAPLYLCADTGGSIGGCEPVHADDNKWCQDDACVCSGALDCGFMITADVCGECGTLECTHGVEPDSLVCSCASSEVLCT